jgi:peptide/nickel transport system permease protein
MVLPVLSLSVGITASYTRLLRTDVIATLKDDYIMMANSKGISKSRVLWRHVLRASSTTLLTSAALNMGGLVGGTIITEILFNLPGLGYQIAFAIASRQVVSLMSFIAVTAAFYVFFNTMVDVIANIVDPRTRERRV